MKRSDYNAHMRIIRVGIVGVEENEGERESVMSRVLSSVPVIRRASDNVRDNAIVLDRV